jgi:hypothetical protein
MNDITKKIVIGIGVVAVVGIGIIIYQQQRTIQQLQSGLPTQPFDPKTEVKRQVITSLSINGVIQKISRDVFLVNAYIIDLSKLENATLEPGKPVPTIQKIYTVSLYQGTVGKDFPFKEGMAVTVYANKPVYGIDSFVATRIEAVSVPVPAATPPAQ